MTRVGFVGLGAMGSRMAARLVDAGVEVVVHNRTRSRETELVRRGATGAGSPAEVAAVCPIVVGCLLDDTAVEAVYRADDGLISATTPGQLFIEHATFSPALARDLGAELAKHDAVFLDAPVSGGPEGAASGTLTAMVGGSDDAFAAATSVLQTYAKNVIHVGACGAGLELKLVNQLLVSCHAAAAAEAEDLLRRMGIRPDVAASVLNTSWASSAMLARLLDRRQAPAAPSQATVGGLATPQRLVRELLTQHNLTPAVSTAALDLFARARAAGRGHHDLTGLLEASSC